MAYAVLASILHITDQILNPDDRRSRSIPPRNNRKVIQSLNQTVVSLLTLLEDRTPPKNLESRIRDSAYRAEDILESHTQNYFLRPGKKDTGTMDEISSLEKDMKRLIDEFLSVEEDSNKNINHDEDDGGGVGGGGSIIFTPEVRKGENVFTVGINEALKEQIMEKLVGHGPELRIVSVVGMGGIGKTTLARNLFDSQTIIDRFDICLWVTVSQDYLVKNIIRNLVHEIETCLNEKKDVTRENGDYVHKSLCGRRHLIVLDDVWSAKAWDDVKKCLPDKIENGSRIMLTTRHVEVAASLSSSHHALNLLDFDTSWNLLCQALFGGEQHCPSKLVKIGKEIARNCRGLPLALVVIVGLLSKKMTQGYWEYIADNVSSILATNDEQNCLEILSLSYNYLPQNLKACFLYMGVFPEDYEISISKLIKLWVAEGFLKPVESKSFEQVAEDSLRDLIDRNLVMVLKKGSNEKPKTCIVHDLVREICIREAKKEGFLYVLNRYVKFDPREANKQRRLSIHPSVIEDDDTSSSSSDDDDGDDDDDDPRSKRNGVEALFDVMKSMPLTRSFVSPGSYPSSKSKFNFGSKLLRVMDFEKYSDQFPEEVLELVNIRYLALDHLTGLPSSISKLRNLQTLVASCLAGEDLPPEIWDMTRLRHLKIGNCYLLAETCDENYSRVLENLQTLLGVMNFKCRKKVLARVPHLRRLKITFDDPDTLNWSKYRLRNLVLFERARIAKFSL